MMIFRGGVTLFLYHDLGGPVENFQRKLKRAEGGANYFLVACSKRSDSGERCRVKKAMKSRGGLGREVRERL